MQRDMERSRVPCGELAIGGGAAQAGQGGNVGTLARLRLSVGRGAAFDDAASDQRGWRTVGNRLTSLTRRHGSATT